MISDLAFQTLAYASVLYLISVGLSVTMGLMGLVNLAHGVFPMMGGYLAAVAVADFGMPWFLMLLVAPLLTALAAAALERSLYARLYGRDELEQVLFSIGLIFIAGALFSMCFGPLLRPMPLPADLLDHIQVGPFRLYTNKLLVIAIGMATAATMLFGIERTRFGAIIRAAVENPGMAESVGLRTSMIFTLTFALGGALGALGGILGTDYFGLTPFYTFDVLVFVQVVVAVAGLGTLRGSFIAALLVSLVQTLSAYFIPNLSTIALFASIFLLLLIRPQGLYGRI